MTKGRNDGISRLLLVAVVLAPAAVLTIGCVEKTCPPGTVRVGDFCKRVDPDVEVNEDVPIIVDTGHDQVGDAGRDARDDSTGPHDVPGDTTPTDTVEAVDNVEPEDTGNPDQYPGGYIGMACNMPSNCVPNGTYPSGDCLSWPRGYCAMPGCLSGLTCPEKTVCMNVAAGANGDYCTLTCDDASDCRDTVDMLGNRYACKYVPDPSGAYQNICYMETGDASDAGGPCEAHEQCRDRMGCLPNFDGGYCAVLSCDASHACPEGTECIPLQGRGVCLKSCVSSGDCAQTGPCDEGDEGCVDGVRSLSRACIDMRNAVTMQIVKVCGSGTVGKAIGEQCLNETECTSGKCNVSYTGICTDFESTGRRCTSDADCAITKAICRQSSEETYGFCTASCGTTACSADQSVCVMTLNDAGKLAGLCVPSCTPVNPEDPFSESDCWEEAGLRCMWGDTKFQPDVRSCVRIDPGDVGTSCRQDNACYSANCIGETGSTDGFCTMPCLDGDLCPFPTVCQVVGEVKLCMKRCASSPDCPGNMTCKSSTLGAYCVPAT